MDLIRPLEQSDLKLNLMYLCVTLVPDTKPGLERLIFSEGSITKEPYEMAGHTYLEVLDFDLAPRPIGMLPEFIVGGRGVNENFTRAYRDTPENREYLTNLVKRNSSLDFFYELLQIPLKEAQSRLAVIRKERAEMDADKQASAADNKKQLH